VYICSCLQFGRERDENRPKIPRTFLQVVQKEIFLKNAVSNLSIFSPADERDFEDFLLDFEEDLKAHHSVQCSPSPGIDLPIDGNLRAVLLDILDAITNSESETRTGTIYLQ